MIAPSARVSVCIPAYNAALYLNATLQSLVAQSYSDIEIIVSDNASTDSTAQIVRSFMQHDARVRYVRNMQNVGYVRNIANAVSAASSDIIAVFHADDVYEKTIIESEFNVLRSRASISAVFSKYRCFSDKWSSVNAHEIEEPWESRLPYDSEMEAYYGDLSQYAPVFLELGNPFCCPSLMTRRKDYLSLGGFTDRYPSNEDLELWAKYLLSGRKLAIVGKTLVNYRRHAGQGSSLWENKLELPAYYNVIDEMVLPLVARSSISRKAYDKGKAAAYLNLAGHVQPLDPRYGLFVRESLVYRFPVFSEKGLTQRFPLVTGLVLGFKQRFRQSFPSLYQSAKSSFKLLARLLKASSRDERPNQWD